MTPPTHLPDLSVPERSRLAELEAVVEAGLQTFVDVGLALSEIRDGRLYRKTHAASRTIATSAGASAAAEADN